MKGTKTFVFTFSVNLTFLTGEPAAVGFVEAEKARIARLPSVVGPRGGVYRLVSEPEPWSWSDDNDYFIRNQRVYLTRRMGRYVRPSRVTPDLRLPELSFDSYEIPVREGLALLPSGQTIETPFASVVVPVQR